MSQQEKEKGIPEPPPSPGKLVASVEETISAASAASAGAKDEAKNKDEAKKFISERISYFVKYYLGKVRRDKKENSGPKGVSTIFKPETPGYYHREWLKALRALFPEIELLESKTQVCMIIDPEKHNLRRQVDKRVYELQKYLETILEPDDNVFLGEPGFGLHGTSEPMEVAFEGIDTAKSRPGRGLIGEGCAYMATGDNAWEIASYFSGCNYENNKSVILLFDFGPGVFVPGSRGYRGAPSIPRLQVGDHGKFCRRKATGTVPSDLDGEMRTFFDTASCIPVAMVITDAGILPERPPYSEKTLRDLAEADKRGELHKTFFQKKHEEHMIRNKKCQEMLREMLRKRQLDQAGPATKKPRNSNPPGASQ